MADITITETDIRAADVFLTTYLKDKIPDADFSEGSVVRDFTVKAVAYTFAFLRAEGKTVSDRQSLLSLLSLPAGEDVDEAVDGYLSNWFLTRKEGRVARVVTTLHFSQQADIPLFTTTQFFKTTDQVFVPDIAAQTVIVASELRPTFNADGTVIDYTTTVTLKATVVGVEGNIEPGRFVAADTFSPYFVYAENSAEGIDGLSVETTSELLERAPTAISVRNLINNRSVDTVLRDKYPGLVRVLTTGFGDPEMMRDYSEEAVSRLKMHVGGHNDIFVSLNRTEVVEKDLTIGGLFARPDNTICVLRDVTQDFVTAGVQPYDVIRVTAGLPRVPREFVVKTVTATSLAIQPRAPFAGATDEADPVTNVTYTVGRLAPNFHNLVGSTGAITTGLTSRQEQYANSVMLTGQPLYKIKLVEVIDGPTAYAQDLRINTGTPAVGEYKVTVLNPAEAQSARAVTLIEVHSSFTGKTLRVTYETVVGYSEIQEYVTDTFERVICANPLARAFHPVYISLAFSFRPKNNAAGAVDTTVVAKGVANFINTFDNVNAVDVSAVKEFIRATYTDIGVIYDPFVLSYKLHAPDGQVYEFTTKDVVTVFPTVGDNSAQLTNGASLREVIAFADLDPDASAANLVAVTAANLKLSLQFALLGLSDRSLRYMSEAADISVNQVA